MWDFPTTNIIGSLKILVDIVLASSKCFRAVKKSLGSRDQLLNAALLTEDTRYTRNKEGWGLRRCTPVKTKLLHNMPGISHLVLGAAMVSPSMQTTPIPVNR